MDRIVTRFLFTGFALLFFFTVAECQQVYRKELLSLYQGIQKHFYDDSMGYYTNMKEAGPDKKYCYLWPLCGLLQASNESEIAGLHGLSLNVLYTIG